MGTGVFFLLCCGPLVVAALLIAIAGVLVGNLPGAVSASAVLVALQVCAAGGVSALYRWCFVRPATRGTGLLASLIVSVFVLSDPTIVGLLVKLVTTNTEHLKVGETFLAVFVEGLFLVATVVVSCTVAALLFELPVRWFQGEQQLVYDGAARALRGVIVIALLVIGSSLFRTEGAFRLVDIIRRALA